MKKIFSYTLFGLFVVAISVRYYFDYERSKKIDNLVAQSTNAFSTYEFIAQLLENEEYDSALSFVYGLGASEAKYIDVEGNVNVTNERISQFLTKQERFLREFCGSGNSSSCINLAKIYIENKDFSMAFELLEAEAMSGNREAIGELVYLYRNKAWVSYSEAKSTEWLKKLTMLSN